ncbi:DsbA family protein [Streptomyces sp. NBC_01431]|uniref:DsbA family protein n=1 Tax=Streptomyces sp. NBC_01431 TaxID=2903863 RepID=UPI002E37077B|nr:thioredoxin domain-containing protein [Streptomyces sp. NBC_01431]
MGVRAIRRAAVVVVAAVGLGLSAAACSSGSGSGASSQAELTVKTAPEAATLAKLPAKVAGAEIVVGDPAAPHTVTVYEDPRCPFCKHYEGGGATAVTRLAAEGKVKVRYTIASFLDANFGGSGSKRAVNAMRAAVEAGKFPEFHAAVFASQPEKETDDALTADNLLKIADKVPGLRGAAFDKAVREDTYKAWVKSAEGAFEDSGVNGSPVVLIDGKKPAGAGRAIFDTQAFGKALAAAGVS